MPGNGLIQGFEFQQVEDRRENFLFEDRHIRVSADNGRLDEIILQVPAAVEYFPALLAYALESSHHVVHGFSIDQRPHERAGIARIADANLTIRG